MPAESLNEARDTRRYRWLEPVDEAGLVELVGAGDLERVVARVDALIRHAFENGKSAGFDEANRMWNESFQGKRVVLVVWRR